MAEQMQDLILLEKLLHALEDSAYGGKVIYVLGTALFLVLSGEIGSCPVFSTSTIPGPSKLGVSNGGIQSWRTLFLNSRHSSSAADSLGKCIRVIGLGLAIRSGERLKIEDDNTGPLY
jgi:hypothetical protein